MGTYLQKIGTDARLICRSEGHVETAWIGPNGDLVEEDPSGKYKVSRSTFLDLKSEKLRSNVIVAKVRGN